MIIIPVLLLSMIVMLAGLFMLAKSKKEQLGKMYIIASSVATGFGILVFVFGITAGILMCCHKACGKSDNCESQNECPMMRGGGMGHCSEMGGGSDCKMMMKGCSSNESSCEMKEMGGKCDMMEMEDDDEDGEVKEIIIKKLGDGENGAEVKVEVEKKSK